MRRRIRAWVIRELTARLLKAVTEEEILLISSTEWLVGKRKLTIEQVKDLRQEAQSFRESELYRLLKKEIRYHASQQRYDKAVTPDDMVFGKAMMWDFHLI